MGKNGDLSDFERVMGVGARRAGPSTSETADLLGFTPTTISGFTENGPESENHISLSFLKHFTLISSMR